jgi:Phosphotransferase enzyme family
LPASLSAQRSNSREAVIAEWVAQVCGSAPFAMESCTGGRNNRVYRVRTAAGQFAVKDYAVGASDDGRERLHREFQALRFLETIGFAAAPRALGESRECGLGLYEFIEGEPVAAHRAADVDAVAGLLRALHEHRGHPAARELPAASASHFSAHELIRQIETRYDALLAQDDLPLRAFLEREFAPEFLRRRSGVLDAYARRGAAPERALDEAQRTLSPSDFGFHNVLRRADGALVFLDFEYFGWDDPVNATGNFLWHPGFALSDDDRRRFERAAVRTYGGDAEFAPRLRALLPLYALRWAMIALNEFLPASWERRRGAGRTGARDAAKAVQLVKATTLVAAARETSAL